MGGNILIGSCGGLTGFYLAKLFKMRRPDFKLWGIDVEDPLSTTFFIDVFSKCPKASEQEAFIGFLIDYINENSIQYYLPTHSVETETVAKFEGEIRNNSNVKFIISPYTTFLSFNNKRNAYNSFAKIGLKTPKLYLTENDIIYPAYAKPEIGSGSKNSFLISDSLDYRYHSNKQPSLLVMEYLDGPEYTVDAVFDQNGILISYNQRVRAKTAGGASICTFNDFESIDIESDLLQLSKYYTFKGVVNFQFILKDCSAYYIDANLRYASGGLPLSIESGMDISRLLIEILDGEMIDRSLYQSDRRNRVMYRSYEERFVIRDE